MAIFKGLKNFAKVLIKGINSTDRINTINHKTEMFIEENGEKVLIKLIEFERGKHGGQKFSLPQNDNFKNFSVVKEGAIEYNTNNEKKYILKRVGSKQIAAS